MRYFENCRTAEDVKKEYKILAFKLHPDCNKEDTTKEFQEMSEEYRIAFEKCKNVFTNCKGETYTKENKETSDLFKDVIDKIIYFENCKVEIIGTWIWVSGMTMGYRDQLKKLKFRWSPKKKAWSYHSDEWKKRSSKFVSLEEIRKLYGSDEVKMEERKKIS